MMDRWGLLKWHWWHWRSLAINPNPCVMLSENEGNVGDFALKIDFGIKDANLQGIQTRVKPFWSEWIMSPWLWNSTTQTLSITVDQNRTYMYVRFYAYSCWTCYSLMFQSLRSLWSSNFALGHKIAFKWQFPFFSSQSSSSIHHHLHQQLTDEIKFGFVSVVTVWGGVIGNLAMLEVGGHLFDLRFSPVGVTPSDNSRFPAISLSDIVRAAQVFSASLTLCALGCRELYYRAGRI